MFAWHWNFLISDLSGEFVSAVSYTKYVHFPSNIMSLAVLKHRKSCFKPPGELLDFWTIQRGLKQGLLERGPFAQN